MEIISRKNKVWYLSYGSNISEERFGYYIKGGILPATKKEYAGCTNKMMPNEDEIKNVIVSNQLYFGNVSKTWFNSGVAFLDPNVDGATLSKMYLIDEEQLAEVHKQEGSGKNWYHDIVNLGEYKNSPILTVTNYNKRDSNTPCIAYVDTISKGIRESYPSITNDRLAIVAYFLNRIGHYNSNGSSTINCLNTIINECFTDISDADRELLISEYYIELEKNKFSKIDKLLDNIDSEILYQDKNVYLLQKRV